MDAYELMIKTNRFIIKDGKLTDGQKAGIVRRLLAAKSDKNTKERFYRGVKYPNNTDISGRRMYPEFFIPPYNNGKKLKTIFNQTPKTQLFSANMYELEIIRLLFMFAPGDLTVGEMTAKTLERLKTTCFGSMDDGKGECFDTSLVVLRFLAAVSNDTERIKSRINNYHAHAGDKTRPWFARWYFWLCLSELPSGTAEPEIMKYKDEMRNLLENKSCIMNSDHDKAVHPLLFYILRNCLCKFPEFSYIKERHLFVSEKDGRLYFETSKML